MWAEHVLKEDRPMPGSTKVRRAQCLWLMVALAPHGSPSCPHLLLLRVRTAANPSHIQASYVPKWAPPYPQHYPRPLLWIWASAGWCRSGKATSSRSRSFSSSSCRCSSEIVSCRSVVTCSRSCFSCCRLCSSSWGTKKSSDLALHPLGDTDKAQRHQQC